MRIDPLTLQMCSSEDEVQEISVAEEYTFRGGDSQNEESWQGSLLIPVDQEKKDRRRRKRESSSSSNNSMKDLLAEIIVL